MKKLIALLLMLVMSTSLLGACGNDDKGDDTADEGKTTASDPAKEETKDEPAKEDATTDSEPEEKTYDPIEIEILMIHPMAAEDDNNYLKEIIKEKFNIDIKFSLEGGGPHNEKRNLLIASDELPDITSPIPLSDAKVIGPKGALVAIDTYFDMMPNLEKYIKQDLNAYASLLAEDGHIYNVPRFSERIHFKQIPGIRLDLVEEAGMEVPTTFDELYTVLSAIKAQNPDAVGIINPDKMNFLQAYGRYYNTYGGSNGGIYFNREADEWAYGALTPGYKELLDDFQKLWEAGLMDPEFFTSGVDQWKERIADGTGVFTLDWADRLLKTEDTYQSLNPDDTTYNFELIMPLVSDSLDHMVAQRQPAVNSWTAFGISSKSPHIERILEMVDWFYTEEGIIAAQWGEEGRHYSEENGLRKFNPEFKASYNPEGTIDPRMDLLIGTPHFMRVELDNSLIPFFEDEINVLYDRYMNEVAVHFNNDGIGLTLTEDEAAEKAEYSANLKVMVEEFTVNYITGGLGDADYDKFVKDIEKYGALRLIEIHNDAYARYKETLETIK